MTDDKIFYRSGYKYQLDRDYHIQTRIRPPTEIDTQFILLKSDGSLTVKDGYAWDGTSGLIIDTDENLRASLVHDAFYKLMRKRKLKPRKKYKDEADKLFRTMCKDDSVFQPIAQIYYEVLKKFGSPSTEPKNAKKVRQAPQCEGLGFNSDRSASV